MTNSTYIQLSLSLVIIAIALLWYAGAVLTLEERMRECKGTKRPRKIKN